MKEDSLSIENEVIETMYHMGGSLSFEEAWQTTEDNRRNMNKVIQGIRKKQMGNG